VRRRPWARGTRVGLLVASLAVLLTGCSAHGIERNLRFGWNTGVTKQAQEMRVLWTWSGVAALAVGVCVWGLIFWCCIRYRKKSDELPKQVKFNLPVEIVYSIFPFLIIGVLFWRTVVVEDNVDATTKNPDVTVQVDAFQWNWQFEYHTDHGITTAYPGTDKTTAGAFLADPSSVGPSADTSTAGTKNAARTTPLPYYLSTVGSSDEIPVLVIPIGQSIKVDEHSDDVIHSFWVPEFLFKRDVIPYGGPDSDTARDNTFEFTATSEGSFVGRCAELCGTYHSQMNFEVRVVSESTFQTYLAALAKIPPSSANFSARQSTALKAAGMAPYATTTYPFNTDRSDRSASQNTQASGS
jgi:cytochrome c oxidase subunit 2